jgi:DNA-directed RNA polymerase subunit N (RpoN/RPB10)
MEPVQCFNCGAEISAKWDAFVAMRDALKDKFPVELDEKTIPKYESEMQKIFYVLGIEDNNFHCKTCLMTARSIKDYIVQ